MGKRPGSLLELEGKTTRCRRGIMGDYVRLAQEFARSLPTGFPIWTRLFLFPRRMSKYEKDLADFGRFDAGQEPASSRKDGGEYIDLLRRSCVEIRRSLGCYAEK